MRFQRSSDVTYDVLDGHAVLIDPGTVEMLTLNPVGTLVWEHLVEPKTCEELTEDLAPPLRGVTPDRLRTDVASFLDELLACGVVTRHDEAT